MVKVSIRKQVEVDYRDIRADDPDDTLKEELLELNQFIRHCI